MGLFEQVPPKHYSKGLRVLRKLTIDCVYAVAFDSLSKSSNKQHMCTMPRRYTDRTYKTSSSARGNLISVVRSKYEVVPPWPHSLKD